MILHVVRSEVNPASRREGDATQYHLRELSNGRISAMIRAHHLLQTQTRLHTPYEISRDLSHLIDIFSCNSFSICSCPLTNARDAMRD